MDSFILQPHRRAFFGGLALASLSSSVTDAKVGLAASPKERVGRLLRNTPLIDGHNDLAWALRSRYGLGLTGLDLHHTPLMTDLARLKEGQIGGQFWSVWGPAELTGPAAVMLMLEQIDLLLRLFSAYPRDLELALTAADVRRIHASGRVASLIGIEGGHLIDGSLPVLRQAYRLGARYLTLTHTRNVPWADSATDVPAVRGLTEQGRQIVAEMNRLGMLVDLAHVSADTMRAALQLSKAPVIFSHSSVRALVDHPRNVPDDVLRLTRLNGGVVMVNFNPPFISNAYWRFVADREAERARLTAGPSVGLMIGQPDRIDKAMAEWSMQHPGPLVTVKDVVAHIEHITSIVGREGVGLGSDFDGIAATPSGLEGVNKTKAILEALAERGWPDEDLAKIAGENLLRVLSAAERIARSA